MRVFLPLEPKHLMADFLVVIRSGATDYDRQGRIRGTLDIPLCAEGIAEAERVAAEIAAASGKQPPIAAIYTSGKRSIHALVRYDVASKAEWDAVKKSLLQIVAPLGADPAALTAVRLSRLPGCTRAGEMQRLLYLCPNPQSTALRMLPELRP